MWSKRSNVSRIDPTAYGRGSTSVAPGLPGGDGAGAEGHLAVGDRWAVLDDEHGPALERGPLIEPHRRLGLEDGGRRG